jgi:hypothetical protein
VTRGGVVWLQRIARWLRRGSPSNAARIPESVEFRLIRRLGGIGGPVIGVLRYRNDTPRRDDTLLVAINGKTGAVSVLKDISEALADPNGSRAGPPVAWDQS